MFSIDLIDQRGEYWYLIFSHSYVTGYRGLVETMAYVIFAPDIILDVDDRIGLPVFTEWWE